MSNSINDQTTPSRINRKRKRRWKASTIADLIKWGLTDYLRGAILCLPYQNGWAGIGVPHSTAQAATQAVFYCAKYQSTFNMSGCLEGRKTASSLTRTPISSSLAPELAFWLSGFPLSTELTP